MEVYEGKATIKSWAEKDRPREKLLELGRRALTDAELIAILIREGSRAETAVEVGKRILRHVDNDLNALATLSVAELKKFHGIGEAKAIAIISALEIGRRRKDEDVKLKDKLKSSKDIYNLMKPVYIDLEHEEFWIILLGRSHRILTTKQVSQGGRSGTIADPKIIFQMALEHRASALVLTHNHPSGNLAPSQQDISLTHKICSAGCVLDIDVLDHVIFNNTTFLSFADEGII